MCVACNVYISHRRKGSLINLDGSRVREFVVCFLLLQSLKLKIMPSLGKFYYYTVTSRKN